MKLLLIFAFFALVCMARLAPAPSTSSRTLILPDYHDEEEIEHEQIKPDEHETITDVDEGHDDDEDDEEEEETTTTTTTTTRRAIFGIPTRNRNLIPSRRPIQTQPTSSMRTTTMAIADDEEEDSTNEYNGDFKYIHDFRKYFQQLMEDIKKLVRKLTSFNSQNAPQRLWK